MYTNMYNFTTRIKISCPRIGVSGIYKMVGQEMGVAKEKVSVEETDRGRKKKKRPPSY